MRLLRSLSIGCRTNSTPKHLSSAGSQITKTLAAISAAGLVFASAGFGAVYAWTTGSVHGPLLASLMVAMAVALELAKPLAVASTLASFKSWAIVRGLLLTVLAAVAIGYSLSAELQLVASTRGDVVAKREAAIEQHDDRRERVKAARTELASLAPARTAEEAQADIAKLLADNPKAYNCRNATANPTARYVCPKVAVLNGEVARAKRRGDLQTAIDLRTDDANSTDAVKKADPGSSALATYLAALGVNISSTRLSDWLTLVPVLALEIGAALALVLVQAVSSVQTGQGMPRQVEQKPDTLDQGLAVQPQTALPDTKTPVRTSVPVSGPTASATEKRTPRKPKKRTRGKNGKGGGGGQQGKRRLGNVVDLLKARGGRIEGGQRAIAKSLGLSKSRVNEVLHELAAAGAVRLATSRTGTLVSLAA
jgi:hypothetical protein